jgi:hypothetical protein
MADTGDSRSIFNTRAAEKLRSPDDLDKYLRVASPSAWAIASALVLLVAGLLVWGVFGAVSTSVSTTGTCVDGQALCLLSAEDVAKVEVGNTAVMDGTPVTVSAVAAAPISRDEAHGALGNDYLLSALLKGDWGYLVYFEGDGMDELPQYVPLTVTITTERIAPIKLLFG